MTSPMIYNEIFPNLSKECSWRNIIVRTGASHGTLQDIKLPDYSGGFNYEADGVQRSLFWRVHYDTIEFVEESTEANLQQSQLRLQLSDSPILQGLSVTHSGGGGLIVLIATIGSVHRLRLIQPGYRGGRVQTPRADQSVLSQITAALIQHPDNIHLLPATSGAPPHTATSCLLPDGRALFLLASPAGGGCVVHVLTDSSGGTLASSQPLQTGSVMGRLLSLVSSSSASASTAAGRIDSAQLLAGPPSPLLLAVCADARLRVWAAAGQQPHQLLAETDLLRAGGGVQAGGPSSQRHQLRVLLEEGGDDSCSALAAAFLTLPAVQLFVLVRVHWSGGETGSAPSCRCVHVTTVTAPEDDLVDFTLTEDVIWALWTTPEGDSRLQTCSLTCPGGPQWQPVLLEPPPPSPVYVGPSEPCSQAYLQAVLHPDRFQLQTIQRALSVYSGGSVGSHYQQLSAATSSSGSSAAGGAQTLVRAVTAAVDDKILMMAPDRQMTDDEHDRLSLRCWQQFYSSCLQYHQVACKPLGVVADSATNQINLVRQSLISYIRRGDPLEQLWHAQLPPSSCYPQLQQLISAQVTTDVHRVVQCCRLVERQLGQLLNADVWPMMRQDLLQQLPPDSVALSVLSTLEELVDSQLSEQLLQQVRQLVVELPGQALSDAVSALLILLQVSGDMTEDVDGGAGAAFSSALGSALLGASVRQVLQLRYRVSRDLLLLLQLLRLNGTLVSDVQLLAITDRLLPETTIQLQVYTALMWLCEAPTQPVAGVALEAARAQFDVLCVTGLELPETVAALVSAGIEGAAVPVSLLQTVVDGVGGRTARLATSAGRSWSHALPDLVASLLKLLWPVSTSCLLPEALLAACQHTALCEYVRLHSTWCDMGSSSRQLVHGLALLCLDRPAEAFEVLVAASDGVGRDEPLMSRLLQIPDSPSVGMHQLVTAFYLKVIRLLEKHRYYKWIVAMTDKAIQETCVGGDGDVEGDGGSQEGDLSAGQSTLWSVMFKYRLMLGDVEEAFETLRRHPAEAMRSDCLRQLLATLRERRQLRQLVELPYSGAVLEEVVSVLQDLARGAADLDCYRLLYALHLKHSDYRRAGRAMYELACRLESEVVTPERLLEQSRSLLAASNALHLVHPSTAWTVRHRRPHEPQEREGCGAEAEGEEGGVCVVTLQDIGDQAQRVWVRFLLLDRHRIQTSSTASVGELVALLSSAGLFLEAVRLARQQQRKSEGQGSGGAAGAGAQPVIRELCRVLVAPPTASELPEDQEEVHWQLLADNQLPGLTAGGSAHDQLWQLLRRLLESEELPGQSRLLRAAAERLLQLGHQLPNWLAARYEQRDAAGLCRLLLRAGRLETAGWLMVRWLEAMLGFHPERFGMSSAVHAASPAVWFPYTQLDQLMDELEVHQEVPQYVSLKHTLNSKLSLYLKTLNTVSADMLLIK